MCSNIRLYIQERELAWLLLSAYTNGYQSVIGMRIVGYCGADLIKRIEVRFTDYFKLLGEMGRQ
jgi:hypothetical protein